MRRISDGKDQVNQMYNMTDEKKKAIMNCTSFDEILNEEYGAMGTPERMKFENDAEAFCLAEILSN